MKEVYAENGEIIRTYPSNYPVYEFVKTVYVGDTMQGNQLKSVSKLPDPKDGDLIVGEYKGEEFLRRQSNNAFSVHFLDGWR